MKIAVCGEDGGANGLASALKIMWFNQVVTGNDSYAVMQDRLVVRLMKASLVAAVLPGQLLALARAQAYRMEADKAAGIHQLTGTP